MTVLAMCISFIFLVGIYPTPEIKRIGSTLSSLPSFFFTSLTFCFVLLFVFLNFGQCNLLCFNNLNIIYFELFFLKNLVFKVISENPGILALKVKSQPASGFSDSSGKTLSSLEAALGPDWQQVREQNGNIFLF